MKKEAVKGVRCRIPMNLQIFAGETGGEGTGTGAGGAAGTGGGTGAGGTAGAAAGDSGAGKGAGKEGTQSFDDFLKGEGNQKEFDQRVQTAVQKALSEAQEKWQLMTDDKVSEAEKLARMTKEEKEKYLQQKREKELADREAAITRRELMAEAKNSLAEKKLPAELADVLNYTDAETCKTSIAAVEKAFQTAVEAAVEDRLKGGKPPRTAAGNPDEDLEKQVEALMMGLA